PSSSKMPGTEKQILLVEDNEDAREVTGLLLEHLGWEVLTASCGADALLIAQSKHPTLVLLDINLPDMDGYALAIALRKAGLKSTVVALSGSPPDESRAQEAGFDQHLMK